MRLKKGLIVLVLCLLFTGCTSNNSATPVVIDSNDTITETEKFQNEYSKSNSDIKVNIPDETSIHYASSQEVLDIITSGTGVVYFGRPTCPWCRNIVPVLAEVAVSNNVTINYYNPGEISSDEVDIYVQIKEEIKDYLRKDSSGNPAMYLPDVYFVKNGEILGHYLGSASTQNDAYTPLTNDQKQELVDIYTKYMKELNN